MTAHRAIIETGPAAVRRLCCGAGGSGAVATAETALDAIDDRVALLSGRPVSVESVWRAALRSVACPDAREALLLVHPSWWSPARVGVVTAAAHLLTGDVRTHPRSRLLAQAAEAETAVVVEIAERLVVITGTELAAIPRTAQPDHGIDDAAAAIAAMAGTVVIDAPGTVRAASAFAGALGEALRHAGRPVVHVDDARLTRLAQSALAARAPGSRPGAGGVRPRSRLRTGLAAAVVVLAAAVPAVATSGRHGDAPPRTAPTTFLVEGRVALTVPADWPTRRVITGPGSARAQATSPADPEVALHLTQSAVPAETLSDTAVRLKRAIDAEPAGVFVDFNPSDTGAGRPAVTYREVRAAHHVRWTVLLDGAVRISVGCQSRPGHYEAVRGVCDQAVRSAHAIENIENSGGTG
ncbi:MAG: type VII secretion-associated protein [Mycobacterium sp.]|nr:type VII secretion-associated protein [Mycobacterium sp.]